MTKKTKKTNSNSISGGVGQLQELCILLIVQSKHQTFGCSRNRVHICLLQTVKSVHSEAKELFICLVPSMAKGVTENPFKHRLFCKWVLFIVI